MRTIALALACFAGAGNCRNAHQKLERVDSNAPGPTSLSTLASYLLAVHPAASRRLHPAVGAQTRGRLPRGRNTTPRQGASSRNIALPNTNRHAKPVMSAGVITSYAAALAARPVLTKSITSSASWVLADAAAQVIEQSTEKRIDMKRIITCALIGLLYYGPATHYWLNWVTTLFPGSGPRSTISKMLLGQFVFGPTVTILCFGAFLVASNGFSDGLSNWWKKVQQDFLSTWRTELCFWPFVDLLAFTLVPLKWISLLYNFASFLWTIFLSSQASRKLPPENHT